MPLYLVGENIDKSRSHYQAETGKLVQLMRGIYVDASDDVDQVVINHAIRIARYLYPSTYLCAASAILLAPTRDGRLYLSGPRTQRTRIRGLEIVQNKASKTPSLASAKIADSMGEFSINASSIRQRFLEAFRVRSEHAASIDTTMRQALATRLTDEYGDSTAASDAVWALARENDWYREGENAEKFLRRATTNEPLSNEAAFELIVAWHGIPIGTLGHDGFEWRWMQFAQRSSMPPIVRQTMPGVLPLCIVALLPEGWLQSVLNHRDERSALRSGQRYMSNITIAKSNDELALLPEDVLGARLIHHSDAGVFTGIYGGPGRSAIEKDFEHNLAKVVGRADAPRLSGVQMKAPMTLDKTGLLRPSIGTAFTHILKPAGTSGFETLPLVEWLGLTLAREVGFDVPPAVLVVMPDAMPPALLIERFDIRINATDQRLIAMEDMCSALNLLPQAKYEGTIERVAHVIRGLSTSPNEDLIMLFKRALFAWLMADGDMHLKNIAFLKIAEVGAGSFTSVRLSPVYDSLTTRVFPGLDHDRMALKLCGKDERLKRTDFMTLASTVGLRAIDAKTSIDQVLTTMKTAIAALTLPKLPHYGPLGEAAIERSLAICLQRITEFK